MEIKVKIKQKRRGTEFFDEKTGSDKETWDDIDSEEDEEWAKKINLANYLKKEAKEE